MQHQYPFVDLYFSFDADQLDVNVHPTKMELRIENNQEVYREVCNMVYNKPSHRDLIPDVPVKEEDRPRNIVREYKEPIPEPFESRRLNDIRAKVAKDSPYEARYPERRPVPQFVADRTKAVAENAPASNSIAGVKYSAQDNSGIDTVSHDLISGKTNYVAENQAVFGTVNNAGDSSSTDNVNNINFANNSGNINNINTVNDSENIRNINNAENTNNINQADTEPEIIEGEQQTLEQLNPSFM